MNTRVLVIVHHPSLYGAQRSLLAILERVPRDRVDLLVAVPFEGPVTEQLRELEIPYVIVDFDWWIPTVADARRWHLYHYLRGAPGTFRRFRRVIAAFKPDVVYTNTVTVLEGALAAWAEGIPHVWHLREAIRGNTQLRTPFGTALVWRVVAHLSDRVIFNSEALRKQYGAEHCADAVVIHNGIVVETAPRSDRSLDRREPRLILTVGYMDVRKGLDVLLDAAKLLRQDGIDFRLVVAGQIEPAFRTSEVDPRISDPDLGGRVELAGWCEDVSAMYDRADLLVSSSRQEAFGRTILEAMSHGLPVVSTRSGGPEEIIRDGETGLLVEPEDPVRLAAAIARVLGDAELARSLGMAGRRAVEERFTADVMAERVFDEILSLERRQHPGPRAAEAGS